MPFNKLKVSGISQSSKVLEFLVESLGVGVKLRQNTALSEAILQDDSLAADRSGRVFVRDLNIERSIKPVRLYSRSILRKTDWL